MTNKFDGAPIAAAVLLALELVQTNAKDRTTLSLFSQTIYMPNT